VLVTVQMGLYLGFGQMVTTMIDHASADLWIMPKGTKCFEDPSLLDTRQRSRALSIPGATEAIPVVIGFADWRSPSGSSTPVFVVGSDLRAGGLEPWNLIEGRVESLSTPNAVAVDRTYFDRLGISGVGAQAEIRQQSVRVAAVTDGIRSFTTTPYVFMDVDRARAHTGVPSNKATYFLVRVGKGADVEQVRRNLLASLADVEVLTPAEFRERSRQFWLFGTGAGAALFAGALLGVIVGTVIVAQTLYSSTKDHLNEFATLRAIGSSRKYIYKVIICQALLSAVIGFGLAYLIGLLVVRMTASGALPIVITPGLTMALFLLTVLMCVVSAIAAIMKVTRIDPAMVFTR
jgi:putative ABC transport system permease protein